MIHSERYANDQCAIGDTLITILFPYTLVETLQGALRECTQTRCGSPSVDQVHSID